MPQEKNTLEKSNFKYNYGPLIDTAVYTFLQYLI